MPIEFASHPSSECTFTEWSLSPALRKMLVTAVAYLYLQQEKNAQRVIGELEPRKVAPAGKIVDNVIEKLTGAKAADIALSLSSDPGEQKSALSRIEAAVWHRDGLLFQHMSWIAARLQLPGAHMSPPHVRKADKGFDGFIIQIDPATQGLDRMIICEDKASEAPRKLITSIVWGEIADIVQGSRDDQIVAGISTLVKGIAGIDEEEFIAGILWDDRREFRVSVATGDDVRKAGKFGHLMDGFEAAAGGDVRSRVGGVLGFPDVRVGLRELALEVIAKMKEIGSV